MKDIPLSKQITSHSFPKERERDRYRNDDEDDVARSTGWRAWGLDDKILLVRQEVAIVVVVFVFFIFFPRGEFW